MLVSQSCLTLCNPMDCSPPEYLSREYLSSLPFPSAGDLPDPENLPDPEIKPLSPAWQIANILFFLKWFVEYQINMQKSVAFLDTNDELSVREIKKTIPVTVASKWIKYLGANLTKAVKVLLIIIRQIYCANYVMAIIMLLLCLGLPSCSVVKNLPANARDAGNKV